MRATRIALAIALCMASASAISRICWTAYRCNVDKKIADRSLKRVMENASNEAQQQAGAMTVPSLTRCVEKEPQDYEAWTLLGLAQDMAGQKSAALSSYNTALALNERPELYANVGLLYLETGQPRAARRAFLLACSFNLVYSDLVDSPLRSELRTEVEARRARLGGTPDPVRRRMR